MILFLLNYICREKGWKFTYQGIYYWYMWMGRIMYVYFILFFFLFYIHFSYNDCVCQSKRKKIIFKISSCRSCLQRPKNISSLKHVIISNGNFFPLKIVSLTDSSSLKCFSPILFMAHLSWWCLSYFSKGSYSLLPCNKPSQSLVMKSNHSKLRSLEGKSQLSE